MYWQKGEFKFDGSPSLAEKRKASVSVSVRDILSTWIQVQV